jgi:hypothetical protein
MRCVRGKVEAAESRRPRAHTARTGGVGRRHPAGLRSGRFGGVPEDPFPPVDGDDRRPTRDPSHGADVENVQVHEIGNRRYIVADVEPLDVDGVRTVAVGTVLWLVAFVLLLPFYGRLAEEDRLDWLWTCVAGFGLGVLGWDHCRRRRQRGRRG